MVLACLADLGYDRICLSSNLFDFYWSASVGVIWGSEQVPNQLSVIPELYRPDHCQIQTDARTYRMTIVNIEKRDDFDEVVKSNNLVVVHFYAEWATQCGPMNEVLEELSKQTELNSVKFVKCLAEELPDISLKYRVSAVPTFLLLRGGTELDRVNGANAAELSQKINQQVSKAPYEGVSNPLKSSTVDLKDRLKQLVNSAPVMLFMKGNAQEPRCGFSKSIVKILNDCHVEFKTFDILDDEEVRQGLKTYSNWPTYPQLYVNGDLIGGLDIVKELYENGELKEMLTVKKTQNIEERLKGLINKAPCMIFMKGNQEAPRCGFSRQLMEVMKEIQVPFETFDILTDEEVRQGLKTYSNWPTYPQVYVNGELIGGLDIINELKASGELLGTLKGQS